MVDVVVPEIEEAIGRRAIYGALAETFSYPTPSSRLTDEVVPLAEAVALDDAEADALRRLLVAALRAPLEERRRVHGLVFTHIEPEDYPPYESAYGLGNIFRQAEIMADAAAFYRAHGLDVGGQRRERPDHIATELEFMTFMAHKEAFALERLGETEVEECRRTQAHFLTDHLLCWAPSFGWRLGVGAPSSSMQTAGRLLSRFLELEADAWQVEAAEHRDEPQPREEPDDGECAIGDVSIGGPGEQAPVLFRRTP